MVTVTTNGSPLIPKVTDRLVRTGLDAIWFSFNGATKGDLREDLMGISYDRVKANIDHLLDVRPPSLRVFVNMIETRLMAPEIAENIRYWESRGVQAGASPLVNRAGNVENFEELRYTPQGPKPVRTCELVFYKMYILASATACSCCMDWRRQVVLGNVARQSLREIWNGDAYGACAGCTSRAVMTRSTSARAARTHCHDPPSRDALLPPPPRAAAVHAVCVDRPAGDRHQHPEGRSLEARGIRCESRTTPTCASPNWSGMTATASSTSG